MTWKPLNPSMFKINFDGAVFKNDNKSGIGVVIRDHQGLVIASLAQQLSHAFQALKIEVLVAAQAITFDVETGIGKVVLKRDSELIITALKAGGQTIALVEPLIQDALVLSGLYSKLLYSHCKRDGNKLAHNLARHFINVFDYMMWTEDVPPPLFFRMI